MSSLEIFAVIISLIGVTLTIKRNMWCWWFNFAAFLLYAYLFYTYKLYGETILQFFFVVVNFYGFYHWLKGKQQDHEIRIEPITARQVILQMLLAAAAGAVFGLSLKYLTDAGIIKMSEQQGRVSREVRGSLFLIGLDRAAKRNAFDSHMIHDLSLALTEYEDDPSLRCAVIFAHGEHFTAGLDLVELQPKLTAGVFDFPATQINPWGTSSRPRTKPVVVAVQGFCFTAGIELMLNADVVIADANTQFAQMEVQRGILPFGGATVRFVQAAGWNKAMRYLLTGDSFNAQVALDLNLITEVVEASTPNAALERALSLAESIAQAAPLAVQATLASAQQAVQHGADYAFAHLQEHLSPLLKTQDVQEGVMAMLQRRPAQFKGQ